jgi:hypothetical protein
VNRFHRRSCFIFPANSSISHLWIVLSDVDEEGHFVTVNVSTARPGVDRTTVLLPKDHKFVKHESVVRYDKAEKRHVSHFELAGSLLEIYKQDITEDLYQRIYEGFLSSPATPRDLKVYIQTASKQNPA